jgi:hypothetical protein
VIPIDLQVEYPWAWTPAVEVKREELSGWGSSWVPSQDPDDTEMYGGFRAEAQIRELEPDGATAVVTLGLRNRTEIWEETPRFESSRTEIIVAYGVRTTRVEARDVVPFAGAGAGLELAIWRPSFWPTHVNPMPHLYGDLGVVVGNGRLRVVASTRLSFGARLDHYSGRAETGNGPLIWSYYPGSAAVSTSAGFQFR